ncbi:MAG: radical SAM family heme chaperone HemW [Candidatus Nanopelagicales bacterium]|jgi:oxygen-independent coproporphyrinogen-3 oxidase|nr:radical SAM family heme chaperone HemW [Candidatus Nanopelagicales bacterium]
MPQQPVGEVPPPDGALPAGSVSAWGQRPFGIYVHVPFCASRCGYCDFNTYTAPELAGASGVDRATFGEHLASEVGFARSVLGQREVPVQTVFVGGGTPTLLAPSALAGVLRRIDAEFGLAPGAEVTLEANPDSVDPAALAALREAGFTRISFGMQSAVPHVLAVLERTHTPGAAAQAVRWAQAAGFEQVSLDCIYGTPGESLADWAATVDAVLATGVEHVSAYALIVEDGTRLAAAVRRGSVAVPDDDLMADMYELADERFAGAGLPWYELSNWAGPGHACRHNLGYWHGDDWWGVGPGAHSHVAGTRWWNVKHPAAYLQRIAAGASPGAGRERLDAHARALEEVLLRVRLAEGLPLVLVPDAGRDQVADLVADGLVLRRGAVLVLTRAGRLLADAVVRRLVP